MTPTGTQLSSYLAEVAKVEINNPSHILVVGAIVILWLGVFFYIKKWKKVEAFFKKAFRNVEMESVSDTYVMSTGSIIDVNNNILNMDMNPINNPSNDIFVPKYPDKTNGRKDVEPVITDTMARKDYNDTQKQNDNSADFNENHNSSNGHNGNGYASNNNNSNGNNNGLTHNNEDFTTDINSFVNLIVRGEEKPVLEFIRKIKDKGISSDKFAADVVLELDVAYRAKLEGETNRRNIVLSQIVSHWSRPKMEAIMSSLLGIVENSYADNNLGTKIALMRIMRT